MDYRDFTVRLGCVCLNIIPNSCVFDTFSLTELYSKVCVFYCEEELWMSFHFL